MKQPLRPAALLALALVGCPGDVGEDLGGPGGTVVVPLAAPTGLTAALVGGTGIRLDWNDNSSDETGYRIDVNDAPFGTTPWAVAVLFAPSNATSYLYNGLANTSYYFRVLAVVGTTYESDPSNSVMIATLDPPLQPGTLTASPVSSTRIDLAWSDVPNESGYRIERSVDGGATWSTTATVGAGIAAYSDVGLLPDTDYGYRVFAFNGDGDSLPSPVATAMTITSAMTVVTAFGSGDVGSRTSIAVGTSGVEHITHYDAVGGNLLYSVSGAMPYPTTTIDTGPTFSQDVGGNGTSVAVDGSGFLHAAAHDRTSQKLRYVTNLSGSWVASTVPDTAMFFGASPKLRISPLDGSVQIVYVDDLPGRDRLRRAVLAGGLWTFEYVTSGTYTFDSFGFAIDSTGRGHVSCSRTGDGFNFELAHAVRDASGWTETVLVSTGRPFDNSIAIDVAASPDAAHVVYYEQAGKRLMHLTDEGGLWSSQPIHAPVLPSSSDLGRHNCIAIDPVTRRIHVAYQDAGLQDLLYARKDIGGSWVRRVIDVTGDVGAFSDCAVDRAGVVHVSYYDASNRDLRSASGAP
jgi:hypothetical protein